MNNKGYVLLYAVFIHLIIIYRNSAIQFRCFFKSRFIQFQMPIIDVIPVDFIFGVINVIRN